MVRSFILNMLAILAGLLGVAALGGVSLSDSASLYSLLRAGVLFLVSWRLFAAGLAAPASRPTARAGLRRAPRRSSARRAA